MENNNVIPVHLHANGTIKYHSAAFQSITTKLSLWNQFLVFLKLKSKPLIKAKGTVSVYEKISTIIVGDYLMTDTDIKLYCIKVDNGLKYLELPQDILLSDVPKLINAKYLVLIARMTGENYPMGNI